MLGVRLLGQFDVRVDGEHIPIASRPSESLFAYLILHAGKLHRREKLAGLLWPVSTERNARNNLRQALWRVRKALGEGEGEAEEYLIAGNFAIGFNTSSDYHLDVAAIEAPLRADCSTEELIAALAQYGGELLPGFYEQWVLLRRDQVLGVYHHKMGILLDRLIEDARWNEAIQWGERWISTGQYPEPAYRAMMLAYYGLGDTPALVAVYERCLQALGDELGVVPSQDTMDLYQSLITGEAEIPTARREPPSLVLERSHAHPAAESGVPPVLVRQDMEGPVVESPFVARVAELNRLEAFLRRAILESGQVAFISGESGSGKTALALEFARRSLERDPDLLFAKGSCNDLTGIGDPFLPFREVLSTLSGDRDFPWEGGGIARKDLERSWDCFPRFLDILLEEGPDLVQTLMPGRELASRASDHAEIPLEVAGRLEKQMAAQSLRRELPEFRQEDLFEQYTRVLMAMAQERPILILLDDLQWADAGSLGLLFHIGRRIGESRVLLICANRPEHADRLAQGRVSLREIVSEFKKNLGDMQIELGNLGEEERRQFVEAYLDTEPNQLDALFREELLKHTGGNPLFTIELLRAMQARGDIVRRGESGWVGDPGLNWNALPARVEGALEERISRIDQRLLEVLNIASVEGSEFTAEVVAQVLDMDVRDIVRALSKKLDQEYHLVAAKGTRRIGSQRISRYQFRHILIQKHLYNRMDVVERAYLHEDVGKSLEGLYGEHSDEIAVHLARQFAEAGMAEHAIRYLLIAGKRAARLSAYEEAIAHFSQGVGLLGQVSPAATRLEMELDLQIALGVALLSLKGYAATQVERTFMRAREICDDMGSRPAMFPILYGLRTFHLVRAEYRIAHELGEQLLVIAQSEEDPDLLLEAHQALGTALFYLAELGDAKTHLNEGIALYAIEQHHNHAWEYGQDPGVVCHSYAGVIQWCLGFPDQGWAVSERALDLAERVAHPLSMALALVFAALHRWMYRDYERVMGLSEAASSLCNKHKLTFWGAAANILLGLAQLEAGLERGAERIHDGLEAYRATGAMLGMPHFLALLAEQLGERGDVEQGLSILQEGFKSSLQAEDQLIVPELHRIRGDLLRAGGGTRIQAGECYQRAIAIAREQGNLAFELRARMSQCRYLLGRTGQEDAFSGLQATLGRFAEGLDSPDLLAAKELLDRA